MYGECMKLKIPDYYDDFCCIADKCNDCCCIGWELDIDDATFDKYRSMKGKFAERLRLSMVDGDEKTGQCNTFRLENDRCPFLNEKNLCEVYINLGESALSQVCSGFPRFFIGYADRLEGCLSLSCEEVGRLLFSKQDSIFFIERETKEKLLTDDETIYMEEIAYVRDRCIDIMQNRSKSIEIRIRELLCFTFKAQEIINKGEAEILKKLADIDFIETALTKDFLSTSKSLISFDDFLDEVFYILDGLEVLGEEWERYLSLLKEKFDFKSLESFNDYSLDTSQIPIWYENLIVYFLHRHLIKAIYDSDIVGRVKFVYLGFFVIKALMAVAYSINKRIDMTDMIILSKAYSKEVEHSEENIAYLLDEFMFSDVFTIKNCFFMTM